MKTAYSLTGNRGRNTLVLLSTDKELTLTEEDLNKFILKAAGLNLNSASIGDVTVSLQNERIEVN